MLARKDWKGRTGSDIASIEVVGCRKVLVPEKRNDAKRVSTIETFTDVLGE